MDLEERHGSRLELVARYYTRIALVAAGIVFAIVVLSGVVPGDKRVIADAAIVSLLVIMVSGVILVVRWERRLVAKLKASDYRLCPRCGYSLAKHTGRVSCPECGVESEMAQLETQWRAFRPRVSRIIGGAPGS